MINLSFVHLHSPLFFAGRNWGEKLDIKDTRKGQVKISYDRNEKEVILECEGKTTIIPTSNVVSMVPVSDPPLDRKVMIEDQQPKAKPGPKPKFNANAAQVSGPHDHVFAAGPGKTRD